MKFGVLRFPGSCDELDALAAARRVGDAELLWHGERDLRGADAIVVPGGFSYGDYLRAGAQFYVPNSSDAKVTADLCGKTITTSRGTNFPATTTAWSDKNCVAAGKPPMTIITDTDLGQQLSNLKEDRAAGAVQGLEAVPTIAAMDNNGYHALGDPFSSTLMGIGFRKDEPELRDAFAFALKKVVADGTYAALIKKWKLDLSNYTEATIDQGPAP